MKMEDVGMMSSNVKIIVLLAIVLFCHNLCNASDAIGYMSNDKGLATMDTIRDTTDIFSCKDAIAKIEGAGYTVISVKKLNERKLVVITGVKEMKKNIPNTNVTQDNSNKSGEYVIYEGQFIRKDGTVIKTRSYVKDGVLVRKTIGDVDIPLPDNVKLQ